jgi:hypothetical protein
MNHETQNAQLEKLVVHNSGYVLHREHGEPVGEFHTRVAQTLQALNEIEEARFGMNSIWVKTKEG